MASLAGNSEMATTIKKMPVSVSLRAGWVDAVVMPSL